MSPLAKLLQIKPTTVRPMEHWHSALGKVWKRLLEILRSARVQRRVRRLELLERIALGNKQSVILLRVDQREFIVGCCGESVVLLVPPQADAVKALTAKRRSRIKVKQAIASGPVPASVPPIPFAAHISMPGPIAAPAGSPSSVQADPPREGVPSNYLAPKAKSPTMGLSTGAVPVKARTAAQSKSPTSRTASKPKSPAKVATPKGRTQRKARLLKAFAGRTR